MIMKNIIIRMLQVSKLMPNPKIVSICKKLIAPVTNDVPDICNKPETAAAAPAITTKGCNDKATTLKMLDRFQRLI